MAGASVNKVILVGRLGRDPEIRYMPDGTPLATLSVATTEVWNDKQTGEKQERTEWHRIAAWRRLGEICGQYLHKGSQVYVEGRLQTRSWEQDGVTRYTTEIYALNVQFLGGRGDAGYQQDGYQGGGYQQQGQGDAYQSGGQPAQRPGSYQQNGPTPQVPGGYQQDGPPSQGTEGFQGGNAPQPNVGSQASNEFQDSTPSGGGVDEGPPAPPSAPDDDIPF